MLQMRVAIQEENLPPYADALSGGVLLEEALEYIKSRLITIARDELSKQQSQGFDPEPITVVDNSFTKPISEVKPFGKIEFISSKVAAKQVILDTYAGLLKRSKILTGTYIEAHFVYLNGKLVAREGVGLSLWVDTYEPKPKDVIRIVNVVPYARKLERLGVTADRSKVKLRKTRDKRQRSGPMVLAPNGAYFLTHRAMEKIYGGNVGMYFGFVRGDALPNEGWPTSDKRGRTFRRTYANRRRPKDNGPYLYPSIKIVINTKGAV